MYLFVNTTEEIAHCPSNFLVCHLIMGNQLPSTRHDKLKESLNKLRRPKAPKTRGAGGSIKPGVKRSGTPGSVGIRNEPVKRAAADFVMGVSLPAHQLVFDGSPINLIRSLCAVARFTGSTFVPVWILGFRCASPQALCCHPLRGPTNFVLMNLVQSFL
jgi:hypothetical protein